ncbi:MAG TPA: TIGR03013 family XrtA/PEP-CTERM system glycosyltransferase [Candidatus Dormibacteraeota bacterium]|nr:TIGR03013 family XrtA/PEP-CTERM system glycosyltransferase [Candidatus Dormibacteraeota bacterium]
MIRLFKVYYPLRTLVLLAGEALIVWFSFVLGTMWQNQDSWLLLNVEGGYLKILGVTGVVLLLSHWLDLYDSTNLGEKWDQVFRILLVLGVVALALSAVGFAFPTLMPGNGSALAGLLILTITLFCWRTAYSWMVKQPFLRERVYVLGTGERAERLVRGLRERSALGIEVVGWTGNVDGELTRDSVASHLLGLVRAEGVHRVIVAMPDRRGTLPVEELLDLRLTGVKVEEATSWLERISGRIEVEQLYPSWLIFADGFRFSNFFRLVRRVLNFSVALVGLLFSLPFVPFIVLAVKLSSPGPALYRQERVGRRGEPFYCYKFRTMRDGAEADTGATWAADDDPRITKVGKFLRSSRLDEIPQLWCVLKGDMHFVGPRPERPEFVDWLSKEIPYYGVRHVVRPGITGWAQTQYKYGNTLEDAREKLQYDLFYIKNASLGLDFLIMFQTIKIVLLGRGGQ